MMVVNCKWIEHLLFEAFEMLTAYTGKLHSPLRSSMGLWYYSSSEVESSVIPTLNKTFFFNPLFTY
jgi:hypothetical protein